MLDNLNVLRYWKKWLWLLVEGHKFYNGGSAPAAPDYVGAAKAQGQSNLLAAIQTAFANNPNVNNPYGTQKVSWDIKKNKKTGAIISAIPTIDQNLSKEQKSIYDKSIAAKDNIADTSIDSSKNIAGSLSKPFSYEGISAAPKNSGQAREDVIAAMMSRVNNDTKLQRDDANSELVAAGLRPGTAAYETAMDRIGRQYNDARNAATLSGGQEASRDFQMDTQARQQGINEMMAARQSPINEFNALQSGSQINSPFAGSLGFQGGANVQAAPTFAGTQAQGQAQQNAYNQQQAAYNGNVSAGAGLLGSLGSAWMSRPG
jgi:hypothetical protein